MVLPRRDTAFGVILVICLITMLTSCLGLLLLILATFLARAQIILNELEFTCQSLKVLKDVALTISGASKPGIVAGIPFVPWNRLAQKFF